jgi:hypothetical protein
MQRYRMTFLAGLAVGFVLGARAGRERYEQIKRATRRVTDSPAAQQAAGAVQAQAANLAKATKQKVADGLPDKVTSYVPGLRQRNGSQGDAADASGPGSAAASDDQSLTRE